MVWKQTQPSQHHTGFEQFQLRIKASKTMRGIKTAKKYRARPAAKTSDTFTALKGYANTYSITNVPFKGYRGSHIWSGKKKDCQNILARSNEHHSGCWCPLWSSRNRSTNEGFNQKQEVQHCQQCWFEKGTWQHAERHCVTKWKWERARSGFKINNVQKHPRW